MDEFSPRPIGRFSDGSMWLSTLDGCVIIVRTDRATRLTTLNLEDPGGTLIASRVLDADDLGRLVDALKSAWEESHTSDVPVLVDVSAVIGRD